MSRSSSNLELPALSADESGGNVTDNSNNIHESDRLPPPKNFNNAPPLLPPSFMDQSFFYGLDQISQDNPLYYMPEQQQQHQQQQQNNNHGNAFAEQFLKENSEKNNNHLTRLNGDSSSTLAHSIASNMESFQAAITTSVGEQPPSFWTGLNNFISNVTHNNIFPTFPNIARSFSEYLSNHPVPFLSSSNNAPTDSPISSPMPSSSIDFDPITQFKRQFEHLNTGLQIRVLGVPQTGAKSRVETQIKLCIQLVTDGGDKAQWWSHLKLPEHMVTKDKLKKTYAGRHHGIETGLSINPEKVLFLRARVLCASDPTKQVSTCLGCIQRERKRSQRRKENKTQNANHEEAEDEKSIEEEKQSLAYDEERILLFNCSELVDFSAGDTILPTRITCYCRHHNERLGFCIYFEMIDHTGKKVAEGVSPPIMITDDHKSNKIKTGLKRRRPTETEVIPTSTPPTDQAKIPTLNWIKSFPFGNATTKMETPEPHYNLQSSASSTASADDNMKSVFKNMFAPVAQPVIYSSTPLMKRLIPNEAPMSGGIEITILGTDFRPGMTVMFGDTPATNVQYWSPNTLICTLPPARQPGAVVVTFKESPPTTTKNDVMVFTYLVETDRALMELALQVVGMKMTGIVEDARKIAMRIVQGNSNGSNQALADKLAIKSEPSSNSL
ncbi:hypothetical protein BDF21DRAFT_494124 [Thamnidium elegans]|nr:hypothetical protein BDF21DRAFT_494124 [Thamnidium elegans]